jgi:hypothetical protein
VSRRAAVLRAPLNSNPTQKTGAWRPRLEVDRIHGREETREAEANANTLAIHRQAPCQTIRFPGKKLTGQQAFLQTRRLTTRARPAIENGESKKKGAGSLRP